MKVAPGIDQTMAASGHVCEVAEVPVCQACGQDPGRWDCVTTLRAGLWANLCDVCAAKFAAYPTTGVGRGQLWIVRTPCDS